VTLDIYLVSIDIFTHTAFSLYVAVIAEGRGLSRLRINILRHGARNLHL